MKPARGLREMVLRGPVKIEDEELKDAVKKIVQRRY